MNCCNNNCNQGRDCPARTPLPRDYLRDLAAAMLLTIASITLGAAVTLVLVYA